MFHKKPQKRAVALPKPRKTRGPRGMGSCFPDKRRGGYRGKVPVGRTPVGKTKYVEVWAPTQGECLAKMKAVQPPGPDTLVSAWATQWLTSLDVEPSTLADYTNAVVTHIVPSFGHRRVRDVTAHDITAAVPVWGKRLKSANTVRKTLVIAGQLFDAARRARVITENPVKDAKKPRAAKAKIDPFTPAELLQVIEACADELETIFGVLAGTGLRLGESLGLDVGDFDAKAGTLSVTKTYDVKFGLRPPKSENSVRVVRVPADALDCVRKAIGTRTKGPLFRSIHGTRRDERSVRPQWKRFLARLGLRYRSPHQLRHSVASAWVGAGVGVGDVAAKLGDAVSTVVDTYVHPTSADPTAALEGLFRAARGFKKGKGR